MMYVHLLKTDVTIPDVILASRLHCCSTFHGWLADILKPDHNKQKHQTYQSFSLNGFTSITHLKKDKSQDVTFSYRLPLYKHSIAEHFPLVPQLRVSQQYGSLMHKRRQEAHFRCQCIC